MVDLTTTYLGLKLRTPLVPSASPLSQEIDNIRRMEDMGASAVVLYSLFEEQLRQEAMELDHHLNAGTNSFAESLSFFPQAGEFRLGPGYGSSHSQTGSAHIKNYLMRKAPMSARRLRTSGKSRLCQRFTVNPVRSRKTLPVKRRNTRLRVISYSCMTVTQE